MVLRAQVQPLDAYKFTKYNTFFCAEPADFTLMLTFTLYQREKSLRCTATGRIEA
jgi:hypothetical protein